MADRRRQRSILDAIELPHNYSGDRVVQDSDDADVKEEEYTNDNDEMEQPNGPQVSAHLMDMINGGVVPRFETRDPDAPRQEYDLPTRFSGDIFPGAPEGLTYVVPEPDEDDEDLYKGQAVNINQVILSTSGRRKSKTRQGGFTLARDKHGLSGSKRKASGERREKRHRRREKRERDKSYARKMKMFASSLSGDPSESSTDVPNAKETSRHKSSSVSEDSFFVADDQEVEEEEEEEEEENTQNYTESSVGANDMEGLGPIAPRTVPKLPPPRQISQTFEGAMDHHVSSQCAPDPNQRSSTTCEGEPAFSIARHETTVAVREGEASECFLCLFGNVKYDTVVSDKMAGLWNLFSENYFSMADTEGLAASMYAYYLEEIYEPGIANGKRFPKWSVEGVYYHITEHMGEPRVFIGESIKMMNKLRDAMVPFAIKRMGENDRFKPDTRVVGEIRMMTKMILDLYRAEPQDMFGFCDAFSADPRSMNRFVHMSRVRVEDTSIIEASKGSFS